MAPLLLYTLVLATLPFTLTIQCTTAQSLQLHFYRISCPKAEQIVKSIARKHFSSDPSLPAGLLRLHFHDCFNRSEDNIAEKEAPPNLTLRGFELIDEIKAELEKQCKGVVSCADILALATRDGVSFSGGSAYGLPTGRRDGTVSNFADVHIPSPSFSVEEALNAFENIDLDINELTTLLGAHAMEFCHCGFIVDRLYNFKGSGEPDPNINPGLVASLSKSCPRSISTNFNISTDPKVFIIPTTSTPFVLDNSFYRGVLAEDAALNLDQQLAFSDTTRGIASLYATNPKLFRKRFAKAMIKLGSMGVLTG